MGDKGCWGWGDRRKLGWGDGGGTGLCGGKQEPEAVKG